VSGNVYVSWLKDFQTVYGIEQLRGAVAFQGRQHLKGERLAVIVVYKVYNLHVSCV
jgi:hypothetical protein